MKKQIKKGKKNHICLNMKTRNKQVVEISWRRMQDPSQMQQWSYSDKDDI